MITFMVHLRIYMTHTARVWWNSEGSSYFIKVTQRYGIAESQLTLPPRVVSYPIAVNLQLLKWRCMFTSSQWTFTDNLYDARSVPPSWHLLTVKTSKRHISVWLRYEMAGAFHSMRNTCMKLNNLDTAPSTLPSLTPLPFIASWNAVEIIKLWTVKLK